MKKLMAMTELAGVTKWTKVAVTLTGRTADGEKVELTLATTEPTVEQLEQAAALLDAE